MPSAHKHPFPYSLDSTLFRPHSNIHPRLSIFSMLSQHIPLSSQRNKYQHCINSTCNLKKVTQSRQKKTTFIITLDVTVAVLAGCIALYIGSIGLNLRHVSPDKIAVKPAGVHQSIAYTAFLFIFFHIFICFILSYHCLSR